MNILYKATNVQVFREKAKHNPKVGDFFNFDKLDAFHSQEVLSVIYGDTWESVLIVDGEKAFLHTFAKQKIDGTDWYDVEPFIGYSGPVINTDDANFIESALESYSLICKEENIVAELVRFNPLLQNHIFFSRSNFIKVFPAKEIVVVNCHTTEEQLFKEFSASTRRNIRYGEQNYQFNISSNPKNIQNFLDLYYNSLDYLKAKEEWYFSESFFQRIEESPTFQLAQASDDKDICSVSLVIEHKLASYYFLTANKIPRSQGANEFLISNISITTAKKGINKLILGGGNSNLLDDSLLLFKKRFSKESTMFYMGKFVHNPEVFTRLCSEAIANKPEIAELNFFLKYRL